VEVKVEEVGAGWEVVAEEVEGVREEVREGGLGEVVVKVAGAEMGVVKGVGRVVQGGRTRVVEVGVMVVSCNQWTALQAG
jgi:hypothetical protein